MSTIKVQIKWGKQVLDNVEVNLADDIMTFKCQIYALTNVPIEKQKVMAKGKMIKDEASWTDYPAVKEGAVLMLMGTAEGKELQAPEKVIQFVEDMTPEQRAKALQEKTGIVIPAGLENLGNTCYMNSVMQCLKRVNELKDGLKEFQLDEQSQGLRNDPNVMMT
jgi:ubiquitin carboxyl-terminal hydrolase 14